MLVQMPFGQGAEASQTQVACEILLNSKSTAQLEPIVMATLGMLADMASYWSVEQGGQPYSARSSSLYQSLLAEWDNVIEGQAIGLDLCAILADAMELSMHESMQDPAAIRLQSRVLELTARVIVDRSQERPKKKSSIGWVFPIVVVILGVTMLGLVWHD